MNFQDRIIREIANEYKLDWRIVQEIVYSPLKFLKKVVTDPADERPVRIMYFGVFAQKLGKKNKSSRMEKRIKKLLDNIDEVTVVMGVMLQFPIRSAASAKKIIEEARDSGDIEKIEMIWNAWLEYNK